MKRFLLGVAAAALMLSGCGEPPTPLENTGDTLASTTAASATPAKCEGDGDVTNREVAVTGETPLRATPSDTGERIINQKATEILGETHYQQVDQTERLRETCRQREWSKVRVVEPEWLTDVEGWIPASAIRGMGRDGGGKRTYVAADFVWDDDTTPHKDALVGVVNRLTRASSDCATIDPGTLAKSGTRSRPGKPVFFITCASGDPHNVWFTPDGELVS